ncbi:hypothetical protein CW693_01460 [Candidatus Bathyarchaeota archaeon]|nr:hypothetical protein [Candidatus Bathyarchaeota archaeon]RJS69786.1 MAG: hypothetical protein CW693_01460 [Candidatus Bathyarchaeota archaeon]RLI16476.1 MAG: hypothetical protein DRO41_01595 [Candidatus Bathyarchaeota archaeon]RLI22667.1 MAG: hypothetical protein DRO45_00575 [Candidatus Bathyarchaeota archaeon]HDN05840.1 hypothetical protein [Candidatus Bathyarchaeota archaeon]
MLRVNVAITNVSAERFWDIRKPIPPIQINTNLNLIGVEKKSNDSLEVPFVLTVNYNPSVAQISLKGRAYVAGDKAEIDKIYGEYKEKKPPAPVIVQSISNVVFIESVLISKTLNIPPPIPLPKISAKKPSEKGSRINYTA